MRKSAKSFSFHSNALWKLIIVALATVLLSATLTAQNQIVTGKKITPAGFNGEIASLPMNIILSPDGKFAITSDMGFHQELSSIDTGTGQTVGEVQFENTSDAPHNGLYYGVAFAPGGGPDYTLYAAQGENQSIAVLSLSSTGDLNVVSSIATRAGDFPSGLATDRNGYLYVANNDPDTFIVPGSVAIYNPNGNEVGRYNFTASYGGTPNFPLAIATLQDGSKTYVASQRDGAVYVLNTTDPTNPTLETTIPTGAHPTGLLFNQAQSLLYVANAHSDSISVVATSSDSVLSTLQFQFGTLNGFPGATPIAVALSPDQNTLYAAMADLNAIAVIGVNGSGLTVRGYIPVGWYPTGVVVSPDGQRLLATNAKGVQTRIPSTGYVQWQFNDNPWYDLNTIIGTISLISVPSHSELGVFTNQVLQNNGIVTASAGVGPNDHRLDGIGLKAGKITHVIYIVKENRTYDQVLGDIPQGNGDPSLVLFGQNVTPSQHALAQRFVLLDNFFDAGEASGDGWPWSTGSMANEYVIKNLPYNYSGRGRNYDFEGQDNGYPAGGFPPNDPYGHQNSQQFPNGLPAIPDVAEAPGHHIWDAVRAAGLSYRNYGFFYTFGVTGVIPDNYPAAAGLLPAGHDLGGVSDFDYRRYDNQYPDSEGPPSYGCLYNTAAYGHYNMPSRFSEWNREFQEMLAQDPSGNSVPAFMTVRFNHDHTEGYRSGNFTPQAEVSDNDYSVGQLVDTISKSVIWQHTAIFVIEDDAQDGPDHVDAHRSTAYVISPYIKQGYVDHTFYNTDSILKTIELLLGVKPLTQYDAIATPILAFDTQPSNGATFNAIKASQDVMCQKVSRLVLAKGNPMRKWAIESAKMNFDVPDSAPSAKLNEVLWKSVKGPNSKMPKIQHGVITATDKD
jgi:YVTN family beta-propeller protein